MAKNTNTTPAQEIIPAQDQTITIPAGNTEAAFEQVKAEQDKAIEETAKETGSIEEAKAQVYVGQSTYSLGNIATASYMTEGTTLPAHTNDVQFEVTNPGESSLQKGIITVSKEVAAQFEEKGFGKIAK